MPCSRPAGALGRRRARHLPAPQPPGLHRGRFAEALTDDTVLVSVQAANSEVGAIQPIRELAELAHKRGALPTDAVQALGKMLLTQKPGGRGFLLGPQDRRPQGRAPCT
ncbi:MAG: aminotransferase class V-fold PLP-dependent enzyme [Adlercreutzia equolifaciens]